MNNILWTGGWDSTFRVLDLVLIKGREVQPYYVLDMARKSTKIELETMQNIKSLVGVLKPGADQLIKDHIYIKLDEIPHNEQITKQFKSLYAESFLGSQYDWLGRYVESIGLNDLELCIHKDDKAEAFVRNDVLKVVDGNDQYYKLSPTPKKEALLLFKNYHFPLLQMTKVEMGEIAKANNFAHIMEQTWFCHTPTVDNKPCGLCNPCKYTREEGLGRRVPRPPLRKYLYLEIRQLLSRIKKLLLNKKPR
ncbi:7-cyano-7-deazaguanine synthase [Acinetobacter indicus]|uniref:7-cyano-7-deazaguanine synthase n=1 Tax=Acinetobacter indicus TaxID=756892 RepID=UPI002574E4FC|nr:7-cyano-7-deazaguanine synthase [Acinetobacter indicus]MDM1277716.1 7-cyano-7-deazaguanine synthase [Acinetobacter indicus]